MVPIKILCGCGQKYAFDVEPVGGQMPWVVACPVCGTDGTAAANMAIAQAVASQPAVAMPAPVALRVSAPARVAAPAAPVSGVTVAAPPPRTASSPSSTSGARKLLPGQIDPDQAVIEAKAKISWGDSPEDVMAYLMIQGFSRAEATAKVQEMFDERAVTIRRNGIGKMMVGTGMLFVPVVSFFIFASMGMIPMKLFAITVMVGLWGAWKVFKGIFMVVSPRSERGDVAEH